jgi:hypothetical protein|tara:strand:- start:51 stop:455 length:405 start_codon:yes stop_codon:yes gene_type:complete
MPSSIKDTDVLAKLLKGSQPFDMYTGKYGSRHTPEQGMKGEGYFGSVPDAGGRPMTEYSVGGEVYGQPLEYPSLVPTLNAEEVQMIQRGENHFPNVRGGINESIEMKAKKHAMDRLRQGRSPYADEGEKYNLPK